MDEELLQQNLEQYKEQVSLTFAHLHAFNFSSGSISWSVFFTITCLENSDQGFFLVFGSRLWWSLCLCNFLSLLSWLKRAPSSSSFVKCMFCFCLSIDIFSQIITRFYWGTQWYLCGIIWYAVSSDPNRSTKYRRGRPRWPCQTQGRSCGTHSCIWRCLINFPWYAKKKWFEYKQLINCNINKQNDSLIIYHTWTLDWNERSMFWFPS